MGKICPGIQEVVSLLQREGYATTDSGDGSHFRGGMEDAWEIPMVACEESPGSNLKLRAERMLNILRAEGFEATVEASFSPNDGKSVILAYGEGLRSKRV